MAEQKNAVELAEMWIDCWNRGTPELIPLAKHFNHTSPFGSVQGRDNYLEWVIPLAAKNVAQLTVLRTFGQGDQAVIHFEMATPVGVRPVCDWLTVCNGEITEIHSFYDANGLIDQD